MEDKVPGFFETLTLWGGLALTWLGGESGRVMVASGAGGLIRWLSTERKRIRDGIIAIIGGGIVGQYLWPAMLGMMSLGLQSMGGDALPESPDNIAMAAFVSGTLGVSGVKILTAMIEARVKKPAGGTDG